MPPNLQSEQAISSALKDKVIMSNIKHLTQHELVSFTGA